ncbi:quinolinate synthase NadA [Desulfohalobium retbaense]|uniref:Quinolinate synthase n=1 Tax=Desulfohalobium retbaense (strain ATCC 49708 / DSM 5692 / JCM 16813 / HR100) TaxID=485915 RepID=C8X2L3_DESRD|nr:quinolinate synthase NadA [Desulfohalobium retbaense]ACV68660.1 quinolinate synthetase complex, A subunit [Desulfohalobium retbaense DSM 5692]
MSQSISESIRTAKRQWGEDLVILGHHYQHDEVIEHTDIAGDSLELARKIPDQRAKHIVFCGVDFMAETASILAQPEQQVYMPDHTASCVMADMAPAPLVSRILENLHREGRRVIPLAYVNSSAAIKALCGQYGGSVCTSANAPTMLKWAMQQGDQVLFLPDQHLGVNTARQLGLSAQDWHKLDIRGGGTRLDHSAIEQATLLLWPGLCAVHARFHLDHIQAIRESEPEARILVHPECHPEVVQAADGAGSTSFLIRAVQEASAGSTLYIGTECNLVYRLRDRYRETLSIHPLRVSACSNMGKTSASKLASLLETLPDAPIMSVDPSIQAPALLALERMLEACRPGR